jgi:hypothetical protein
MATQIGTGTGTTLATFIPDLADTANIQTALKQLYYGTTNATLSQTTGIYGALYTLYTGNPTLSGNVTISGTLTVNGGTTTINSTTITIDDKLIELGAVASPTNTTADGGGISLFGTTNKTILWDNTNANWTTSENWNLATGKTLKINNVNIASGTGADLVLGANASSTLALGNTSGTTTLNGVLSVNNPNRTMTHLMGYTSTVTSGTPVVLTNTSSYYQQFTGSTAQTVTLPVTSTLAQGWTFHIVNNNTPTGDLIVNSSGGNLVITVPPGTTAMVTCIATAGTGAANWEAGLTDFSTYTGTGANVMATSPTFATSVIGSLSMDVFDTVSTTLNIGRAATALTIGSTTGGISTVQAGTTLNLNAPAVNGNASTLALFATPATITGFAAATSLTLGSTSAGTLTINNPTIATSVTTGTLALFNTGLTTATINMFGSVTSGTVNIAATAVGTKTVNIGTSTGTVALNGSVSTSGTLSTGGKFGYTTDGGNITQSTSKVTGVTLNQLCGTITLATDALASQTTTSFTFTNSTIASNDIIVFSHVSGGTIGAYNINAISGTGTATVYVRNINSGLLAEAPVFRFIVIKA